MMDTENKKKYIIDNLLLIKGNENSKEHYKFVLNTVKENNVNITKNKRGYYFNLNNMSNESIDTIFNYMLKVNATS
jgi:hypothetical protein